MNEITTTDLARFGYRELDMAADLLKEYAKDGAPEDFDNSNLQIMMNFNSGYVFLTNEDGQTLMMNGDKLEKWFTCPECSNEGFAEDIFTGKSKQCNSCKNKIEN